jgi:uncharacterized protein (TIGR00255 family)
MALRSMTAYAGAERELGEWLFSWEIRSVNHRYLDLAPRLPESLRFMEADVRALVASKVKRGRLDMALSVKPAAGTCEEVVRLDPVRVAALLAAVNRIQALGDRAWAPFSALDVLNWPGVLHEAGMDRERMLADALLVLDDALDRLVAMRENEGRQLAGLIEPRLRRISEQAASVRARMPSVVQALRQKIVSRIQESALKPDTDRLEQEMVYLAQKMDVAEELDRLDAHVAEMLRALAATEPAGRRLDFLSQELNREANTLGSKSADLETTQAAVEIKVLIEQIREQVQNVE